MWSSVFIKSLEIFNQTRLDECRNICEILPGIDDFPALEKLEITDAFFVNINYNFESKNWLWVTLNHIGQRKCDFRRTVAQWILLPGTKVTLLHTLFWTTLYSSLEKLPKMRNWLHFPLILGDEKVKLLLIGHWIPEESDAEMGWNQSCSFTIKKLKASVKMRILLSRMYPTWSKSRLP